VRHLLTDDGGYADANREIRMHLEDIAGEISRVARILSEVRAFAQQAETRLQVGSLNQVVGRVLGLTAHRLKLEEIRMEQHLAPDLPAAYFSPAGIQQLVLDLVLGAADALWQAPDRVIRVMTGASGGRKTVYMEVSDNRRRALAPGLSEAAARLLAAEHGAVLEDARTAEGWTARRLVLTAAG
jgi:C4-dicarboxylate-specific signal transduction histidine kinase